MSEKILEVKNLRIKYAVEKMYAEAVNGIDFNLNKGEILGLVGETGAGKTTTALSIMGLLPKFVSRAEGEILYRGENVLTMSEKRLRRLRGKEISMIFQDPMTSLNPVFTVGYQIADVIRIHNPKMSHSEINKKVDEMMEMVGIPAERKCEYPHQFSGGMKQRIVIAIALACNPEILIADEPTTALDVTIQAQVMLMMRELQKKQNSAVILITHDLGLVASFCDKVAVVYAGEIVEAGTIYDIFDKNKCHHPYTEGLFGSIPDITIKTDRLKPIPGLTPHPTDLPRGCKFHPRCSKCIAHCKTETPPTNVNGTHLVRCHVVKEEA